MNLNNWISQAREHWKEHQPSRVKALRQQGKLGDALRSAAEQTHREMTELEAQGMTEHESWEMTRERYLFPPAETTQDDPPASEAARLFGEAQALMSDLDRDKEPEATPQP